MRMHSITIWVLLPRERRERILWVIIFTHVGAMYKMMLPPANSGSAPGPLLRPSVFNMAVLPICIGCAFRSFVWRCCLFVRYYHCRSGVEEGRLGNVPCRLPRFGTTLCRGRFGPRCDRWFHHRFMHGGRRLFFVVRGRILFRSQGANQVFGVARVRPGQCTHVLQFLESLVDFAL